MQGEKKASWLFFCLVGSRGKAVICALSLTVRQVWLDGEDGPPTELTTVKLKDVQKKQ